ncbi:hypothetical protein [Streptomyces sp. NPDC058268]|uniref:hypothetical protein n=1 Tax=Streptomyces sp. NPDC058268 TaxID=3346413 RepID=UPI0036E36061
MPDASGQRTHIPSPCWDQKPGDVLHCTLGPKHGGDHFHAYTKSRWSNRGPARQG